MTTISRRELLKLAGGLTAAATLIPLSNFSSVLGAGVQADSDPPPTPLGRVAEWSADIRTEPNRKSKLIRTARRDDVLTLIGQIAGQAVMPYNAIWFQTDQGFVYSSYVQPVQNNQNPAEPDKAENTFWGEISVPFTDAHGAADAKSRRSMRLYYSTVYRVVHAEMGKDDQWWYRLKDGFSYSPGPYIPAAHIRRIDPSELTPLSPDVADKRVEVNLKAQRITAFENGNPVLTSLVSSGVGGFGTPRGPHKVLFKSPTARMIGGAGAHYYDLPGVPFPTFITWSGVAVHGTYWHNDYGRPRSHGCLNVPSEVAKWFWRWTMPEAPYDKAVYYTPHDATATVVQVS
jgi:lipoprotein-anchoring transpeptidase ErfK/SrfK